jgi:hypothetical protein
MKIDPSKLGWMISPETLAVFAAPAARRATMKKRRCREN